MNERIKELAEQAGNYALDEKRIYERMHNTEQCMEEYREVYNAKFAELIVRECQQIVAVEVKENCKPDPDWGRDDWSQGYVSGMWAAINLIKEHFGVEV